MKILVTGANGQLGSELRELAKNTNNLNFIFIDIEELNITSKNEVARYFKNNKFDYCVNCAAYTAVDKSETDKEQVELVNINGVKNLTNACSYNNTVLIHISTDFVFDGKNNRSYKETDKTNPINVYGDSKLKGEIEVQNKLQKFFIIRTSWLYSSYGNNFVKTMLRLSDSKDSLSVVDDQIGTPTYANDLAKVILKIIESKNANFGVYHYSNEGVASWYDFAKMIFEYSKKDINLLPINSKQYPLPAKRPKFTVLNKNKIKNDLDITIPHWIDSLKDCLKKISN